MKFIYTAILWFSFTTPIWSVELRIPCVGRHCHDGDTFYVEVEPVVVAMPNGFKVDGVEKKAVVVPPFLINVRLVDNHVKGKTKGINAPEVRTPSGRAQKGALQARDRLKELVEEKQGELIN